MNVNVNVKNSLNMRHCKNTLKDRHTKLLELFKMKEFVYSQKYEMELKVIIIIFEQLNIIKLYQVDFM